MPLPDGWNGVFYSEETNGDMLFDIPASEFVDTLIEHRPEHAKFFVAGACFDLLRNGERDRFGEFIELAKERWSEEQWGVVLVAQAVFDEMLGFGVERSIIGHVIHNLINGFFDGGVALLHPHSWTSVVVTVAQECAEAAITAITALEECTVDTLGRHVDSVGHRLLSVVCRENQLGHIEALEGVVDVQKKVEHTPNR